MIQVRTHSPLMFLFLCGSLLHSSQALCQPQSNEESAAPQPQYVTQPSIALRSSPGGELLRTLLKNTAVLPLETKGAWTHVTLDAWVRASEISSAPTAKQAVSSDELKLASFSIEKLDKDKKDDASRIALKIQLQNTTSHGITSWSAFIVLSDETGKVVLRSTVEGGAMASRESKTFQFVWSDEEKEYGQLSPYSLDSSKLIAALNQVILK